MIEVRFIRHAKETITEAEFIAAHPHSSRYNADIVPGESIRLHGVLYPGTRSEKILDKTFRIGDTATYDSYNLVYLGTITKISPKTVTIQPRFDKRTRRLSLYEFAWRHSDFSVEKAEKNNNEWYD